MSCFWYFPSQIWPRINARRVNSHAEANEHIHSLDYEMWLKFIISPTLFLCHLCRCFFVHDSLSFLSYCLDVTRRREFWEMLILRVKIILKFYDQSFFFRPSLTILGTMTSGVHCRHQSVNWVYTTVYTTRIRRLVSSNHCRFIIDPCQFHHQDRSLSATILIHQVRKYYKIRQLSLEC